MFLLVLVWYTINVTGTWFRPLPPKEGFTCIRCGEFKPWILKAEKYGSWKICLVCHGKHRALTDLRRIFFEGSIPGYNPQFLKDNRTVAMRPHFCEGCGGKYPYAVPNNDLAVWLCRDCCLALGLKEKTKYDIPYTVIYRNKKPPKKEDRLITINPNRVVVYVPPGSDLDPYEEAKRIREERRQLISEQGSRRVPYKGK